MLKYRIKQTIEAKWLTREGRHVARLVICKACNIRMETLSRWENIRESHGKMIPADMLLIIAKVLDVDILKLFSKKKKVTKQSSYAKA